MSLDTAKIVLKTGRLRWQSPCQFNDVNEMQRMPRLEPEYNEAWLVYARTLVDLIYNKNVVDFTAYSPWTKQILLQILQLNISNYSEEDALKNIEKNIPTCESEIGNRLRKTTESKNDGTLRCFCLSEDENNATMWAHYGEVHKGCMLGFGHIEHKDTPFLAAEKVSYTAEPPVVGSALNVLLYGPSSALNKKTRLAIFYNKEINWAYEKEWRVMINRPAANQEKFSDLLFYPEELTSVTFGSKVKDKDREEILKLIEHNYPHCEVFEINLHNGTSSRVQLNG
jgi:hypothetical protein